MQRSRYFSCLFVSLLILTPHVHAAKIPLQDIDKTDLENVVDEVSTNFLHTSVSGASSLGRIFGFEVGVIGGMTKSKELQKLAHEVDASAKADEIPHGALLGVLTVPLGLTAEANVIPEVGGEKFKFSTLSLAGKWTPTDIFFDWPLSVAIKAQMSKTQLEMKEEIAGGTAQYKFEDVQTGAVLLVSKNLAIVEPYVGFGYNRAKGTLEASGSNRVFDPSLTSEMSASAERSGALWMVGTELKLIFLKAGLEYTRMYDTSRYTGKVSVFF